MRFVLSICLPRDQESVPVVRHLAKTAMLDLGVSEDCVSDVEVALTEAVTNVLQHALGKDEYEVEMRIDEATCEIRVTDTGRGFDQELLSGDAAQTSEGGRGIMLMRALVDDVSFASRPEEGTVVHLVKVLHLDRDAGLERMGS